MMLDDCFSTFLMVQLHPWDQHQTTWQTNRATFYSVGGTPTAWFDGVDKLSGSHDNVDQYYAWYQTEYLARRAATTDVTIELSGVQVSGPEWDITAHVCIEGGGTGKTMRIYMVQVLDYWPITRIYHRNGFKQAASTTDVTLAAGECEDVVKTFTFDGDSWGDQENIKIIAWSQEPLSSWPAEIFQAMMYFPVPPDCNTNGDHDFCDIDCGPSGGYCDSAGCGTSGDCNVNRVPDECDIASGASTDDNANDIPDECEIACTCGDLNGSGGAVSLGDFNMFSVCFGLRSPTPQCPQSAFECADLNQDDWISLADFNTFQVLFGTENTNSPPDCVD